VTIVRTNEVEPKIHAFLFQPRKGAKEEPDLDTILLSQLIYVILEWGLQNIEGFVKILSRRAGLPILPTRK
jgi:hypothetical protein